MGGTNEGCPSAQTLLAMQAHADAWEDLEDRYGILEVEEASALLGIVDPAEVAARTERGELLGVVREGRMIFPRFQFVAGLGSAMGLGEILAVFRDNDWAPDSIALWFVDTDGYCNGAEPAAILASNPDLVLSAARSGSARW